MNKTLSKNDLDIFTSFEKNVKNINELLSKKSIDEIKDFFASQDEMLNTISNIKLRKSLLANLDELKKVALENKKIFDSVFDRLINIDNFTTWKNKDNIIKFFDNLDKDISKIYIQNLRHILLSKSNYFRKLKLDELLISSS